VLNITAWNFADDRWHAIGEPPLHPWHLLDHASAPITLPLAFWFILVFVGQEQKLRWVLWASWAWALVLGLPSLLPPLRLPEPIGSWADGWVEGSLYRYGNLIHLSVLTPLGVGLLLGRS
jgi:hypothetical protein